MKKVYLTRPTTTALGLITLISVFESVGNTPRIYAQCSSQPPTGPYSAPPNTKVYYQFSTNSSFPSAVSGGIDPETQIQQAFSAWNAANAQAGGDGIDFEPATSQNPATVTLTTDTNDPGSSATTSAAPGVINSSNPATITFHVDQTLPQSTQPIYDPNQPGFDTSFLQSALHEIGHLQGIGDYPAGQVPAPNPNQSVMGPWYGVNDTDNPYPMSGPSPCDQQQAAQTSSAVGGAGGAGGGGNASGGNGGSNGSGGSGDDNEFPRCGSGSDDYWDDSTNTLYGWSC